MGKMMDNSGTEKPKAFFLSMKIKSVSKLQKLRQQQIPSSWVAGSFVQKVQ